MKLVKGKVILNGIEFENPLDTLPLKSKLGQYREWKEGERTSFKGIWLDRYVKDASGAIGYEATELKISNRGKCFLDGKEVKQSEEISAIKEIFSQIKVE